MRKINTLLIDNGSCTIKQYFELFYNCDITVCETTDIKKCEYNKFDLLILSDGSKINVNKNVEEIKLVESCEIPIIGVCYGFQLLSYCYGIDIHKLPDAIDGLNHIHVLTNHPMFAGFKSFYSFEKHRFGVTLSDYDGVICHAISSSGIEVMEFKKNLQFGFQFHPEISLNDNQGSIVIRNLIDYLFE